MNDAVREIAVDPRILVHGGVEILAIFHKVNAQSVMQIEHARDAIESVAINMELIQPKTAIGEQKMQYVHLAIVETARIPTQSTPSLAAQQSS